MLSKITECFADAGVNIAQQINQSRGDVAYNVIDLDPSIHEDGETICLKDLQRKLTMQEGVLSTRILFGTPGKYRKPRFPSFIVILRFTFFFVRH